MRHDDDDLTPYTGDEARAFAELPRELPLAPGETDRMTRRLRSEGLLRSRASLTRPTLLAAAAMLLFALGVAVGGFVARRNSLEDLLARTDLNTSERVLLLQRAGSAYVRAAQGYADATAHADSTAIEVASNVLVGAAHAVARTSLDAGMAARLSQALQPAPVLQTRALKQSVIWF